MVVLAGYLQRSRQRGESDCGARGGGRGASRLRRGLQLARGGALRAGPSRPGAGGAAAKSSSSIRRRRKRTRTSPPTSCRPAICAAAIDDLRRALDLDPQLYDALYNLAMALDAVGRRDEARPDHRPLRPRGPSQRYAARHREAARTAQTPITVDGQDSRDPTENRKGGKV